MKSRMTQECHVRFREGLGVKFPGGHSTAAGCLPPRGGSSAAKVERTSNLKDQVHGWHRACVG